MNLSEIAASLDLRIICGEESLDKEVTIDYMSDLLSDVMGHTKPGDLWITLQIHPNIIGVAVLKRLAAIIINDREPEIETVNKARAEKVPLLVSSLPAFELVGRLYRLGIRGQH